MTTFTTEDREAALEPIPFAGYVPVEERNELMTNQTRVNPEILETLDELQQRLDGLIADYERLKAEYAQLKEEGNRYIQLWLETKPKKPLSVEAIRSIWERNVARDAESVVQFVRAVEAAHGITE